VPLVSNTRSTVAEATLELRAQEILQLLLLLSLLLLLVLLLLMMMMMMKMMNMMMMMFSCLSSCFVRPRLHMLWLVHPNAHGVHSACALQVDKEPEPIHPTVVPPNTLSLLLHVNAIPSRRLTKRQS
jgi:hypothetical protein